MSSSFLLRHCRYHIPISKIHSHTHIDIHTQRVRTTKKHTQSLTAEFLFLFDLCEHFCIILLENEKSKITSCCSFSDPPVQVYLEYSRKSNSIGLGISPIWQYDFWNLDTISNYGENKAASLAYAIQMTYQTGFVIYGWGMNNVVSFIIPQELLW